MMKFGLILVLLVATLVGASCGGGASEPVSVEVTRLVPQTVEVTKIVPATVEVTRIVQVAVTDTPKPGPPTATATSQKPIELGEPIVVARKAYDGTTDLNILVTLKNPNSDWWLPTSQVTASIFDAAGNIIATDNNVIAVPPGKEVAFILTGINIADKTYDKIQIDLTPDKMRPSGAWPNAAVELVQSNLVGDKIVGQLKNTGGVKIPQTKVIAVVRNANGEVIAVDFAYADESEPDQVVPFDMSLSALKETDVKFDLYFVPELVSGIS